jgi:hypothetical protein
MPGISTQCQRRSSAEWKFGFDMIERMGMKRAIACQRDIFYNRLKLFKDFSKLTDD